MRIKGKIREFLLGVGILAGMMLFECANTREVFAVSDTVCGDFTVTGGEQGVDYIYEDGVLTVLKNASLIIRNTDPDTPTTDRIKVVEGLRVGITLAGVNIDVSSVLDENMESVAAFEIISEFDGRLTLTLADGTENVLISGTRHAGLEKMGGDSYGVLIITGDTGMLTAIGGEGGAGIGSNGSTDNIIIKGGSITATGGKGAAGIGGGYNGQGYGITIEGGEVTAQGGKGVEGAILYGGIVGDAGGAGIGGGGKNRGQNIVIKGGTVTATGKDGGAGIGGGMGGAGSYITINDGKITATGDAGGAGIGGGYRNFGFVEVNGGEITAIGGDCKDSSEGGRGIGDGSEGKLFIWTEVYINGGEITAINGKGYLTDRGEEAAEEMEKVVEEPATGDGSALSFYITLAILSVLGIRFIGIKEKKRTVL